MPVSHCLDYYSFVLSFEIRMYESSNFVLLCPGCLAILVPLHFHIFFRIVFLISVKKTLGDLIGVVPNV